MDYSTYMPHMRRDKKVEAGNVRFVLPKGIGQAVVTKEVSDPLLHTLLD